MPEFGSVFQLTVHPGELFLRGTVMYWFLFLLLRFVLRRDMSSVGIADLLLLVLIADASQNALSGSYESVTDGFILVATIAGWNWALDMMSYRFLSVRRLMEAKPVELVRAGKLLKRNLRHEMITIDELMAKLRENGIEKLEQVKVATMESDGEISVVKANGQTDKRPRNGKNKDKAAS
jgi:uncharacterized membrane protein YcaP (DUF421 family)